MFKWCCLAVAVVALLVLGWMINDMRLAVRQQTDRLDEHLPKILERTDRVTKSVNEHLPPILERADATSETVASVSQDVKLIKEIWSVGDEAKDEKLAAYTKSVLTYLKDQDAVIGTRPLVFGKGLKNPVPAREWVATQSREGALLALTKKTKADVLTSLCRTLDRRSWYIQFGDKEPVELIDWLKKNHPESMDVK